MFDIVSFIPRAVVQGIPLLFGSTGETLTEKSGNLNLGSGADVILIPEIPYDLDKVAELIEERNRQGKRYSIIACAEGAVSVDDIKLDEEASRRKRENSRHSTVSYEIADRLEKLTGKEARVTVPGHYQRGGPPCPYDRVLATQFGVAAADLIINKQYGRMVAVQGGQIVSIPLEDAASKTKFLSWTRSFASRLESGSSMQIIAGPVTRARAMATRCCWPPESCETAFLSCSSLRSTFFAISRTRLSTSAFFIFLILRPKAMLS